MNFKEMESWVFDLDNTLYPAQLSLFDLISERITQYVHNYFDCEASAAGWGKAKQIQKSYFMQYGTTLNGLMLCDNINPSDYLSYVHNIDLSRLDNAPKLVSLIERLPGKKYIFTNGDAHYALQVIDKLGLTGLFDHICDIRACGYQPKPNKEAYLALLKQTGIDPLRAVFFEDMARNLEPAKSLGMRTIWINTGSDWGSLDKGDFIDVEIASLQEFLEKTVPSL